MCPCSAVVVVMAFPPVALHSFIGNIPPSDFLSRFGCSCFIITCSTYSLLWKTIQDLPSCRLFPMSNMPCFTTPKQFYDTCHARHRMGTSRRGTLSSCLRKIISRLNHFNFRLRPAGLCPSCLTFGVTSACPMFTIWWLTYLARTGLPPAGIFDLARPHTPWFLLIMLRTTAMIVDKLQSPNPTPP